ncbi:MAG: hypothetical protein Kapaf2KO_17840 [Candidatus Kapaibacteriales bacterium]
MTIDIMVDGKANLGYFIFDYQILLIYFMYLFLARIGMTGLQGLALVLFNKRNPNDSKDLQIIDKIIRIAFLILAIFHHILIQFIFDYNFSEL